MTTADAIHPEARARQRAMVALAVMLFVSYAYFYQAGGWNQNSRFALIRAIVEHGTLRTDETARYNGRMVTGDYAQYNGHYYAEKAPGLALLGVVPVALARPFVESPTSPAGIATLSYIATVVAAGLPTVFTALMLFQLSELFGIGIGGATLAATVFGLGSPAWCYATVLYGHALSTACLTGAFTAAVALANARSQRRDWWLALGVGVGGGWATLSEYPMAIPAVMVSALAIGYARWGGASRLTRVAGGIAGGALACAAVLAWYNYTAFGSPLQLGYQSQAGFQGMEEGLLGLTYPKSDALMGLLFGSYRGLFYLAPILAAAPVGLALLAGSSKKKLAGLTAVMIASYFLLFNASFYYWDGGWSYGPRHMSPALPFLSLALAPLWSRGRPILRLALVCAALYGAGLSFVAVSTTAQPPETYERPVTELLWPSFISGQVSLNWQSYLEERPQKTRDPVVHAWNLGEKMGLRGLASLVPLVACWSMIALVLGLALARGR